MEDLSNFRIGRVNAPGDKNNVCPVIPKKTGKGRIVSTVIFDRICDNLEH